MRNLYSEADYEAIRAQLKKRLLALGGVLAVFLAAVIWTLVLDNHKENRPEVLTTVFAVLGGFVLIFGWDMLIRPLRCYEKHLAGALHGRSHETVMEFSRRNEELSVVEGVTYRDLIFLGEPDKHGDRERLFYWDAQLPDPPFTPGQQVTLSYYDRFISAYSE